MFQDLSFPLKTTYYKNNHMKTTPYISKHKSTSTLSDFVHIFCRVAQYGGNAVGRILSQNSKRYHGQHVHDRFKVKH